MIWIETKQGLLNLTRASQVRIAPALSPAQEVQLEVYMDSTDYLVIAQGTAAAMAGHLAWIKGLISTAQSGIFTRGGL